MTRKQKQNFFSDIPPTFKGIIILTILGGGTYVIYRMLKGRENLQQAKEEITEEQKELKQSTIKPKITKSQAEQYANNIFAAMDGYGTDVDAIKDVFNRLQNNQDFLLLSISYGVRTVSSGRFNLAPDFTGTMSATIIDECSDGERKELNDILASKGITQRV